MGRQKTEDEIHEMAAEDMAIMMAQLVRKYRHFPKILAMVLTDSLGAYLAMVSDTPQKAIDIAVKRLQNVEITKVRANYYGFKLGVVPNDRGSRSGEERTQESSAQAGSGGESPGPGDSDVRRGEPRRAPEGS